ncbi:MAG TPA: hypothetical protein VFL76_03950 [Edaphocola sp.]|nr:hypothetical protein [Edaphocola sp.]
MKKPFLSIFLIFSLLATACHSNNKNSEISDVFKTYLKTTFKTRIPQNRHYYFLVPSTQCGGCNFYDGKDLDSALNENLTIISTFPTTNFSNFKHLWEDTSKQLLNLAFVNYTNKLLVTKGGEVQSVSMVYNFYHQLDSLYRQNR